MKMTDGNAAKLVEVLVRLNEVKKEDVTSYNDSKGVVFSQVCDHAMKDEQRRMKEVLDSPDKMNAIVAEELRVEISMEAADDIPVEQFVEIMEIFQELNSYLTDTKVAKFEKTANQWNLSTQDNNANEERERYNAENAEEIKQVDLDSLKRNAAVIREEKYAEQLRTHNAAAEAKKIRQTVI